MSCEQCVGINEFFTEKEARKKWQKYLKKGPGKVTEKLISIIRTKIRGGESLLDIGGGIGIIHHELIREGVHKVHDVEASSGYLKVAKEAAESKNIFDKIKYSQGDFLELASQIPSYEIVTMDKVICCYPHYNEMLNLSLERSSRLFGIVFPKSVWIAKIISGSANIFLKTFGKSTFRSFIHPSKGVLEIIQSSGFKLTDNNSTFKWHIWLFEKSEKSNGLSG